MSDSLNMICSLKLFYVVELDVPCVFVISTHSFAVHCFHTRLKKHSCRLLQVL